MMTTDLFAEFDAAAERCDWRALGQPERLTRRYGRGGYTLRVYANRAGTGVVGATLYQSGRMVRSLGAGDAGKRDAVVEWFGSEEYR